MLPVGAKGLAPRNQDLGQMKIINADKLEYQDGNSILTGNVKLRMGNFNVSTSRIYIDNQGQSQAQLARFEDAVIIKSDDLEIHAPKMNIDIPNSKFKCWGNHDDLVISYIKDSKLYSVYQEYDLNANQGKAYGDSELPLVKFENDDYTITSKLMDFALDDNKKIKYVDFLEDVNSVSSKEKIEAEELIYFPNQEIIKASNNVKLRYLRENNNGKDLSYLFADALVYEKNERVISAFSRGLDREAEFYNPQVLGKARQILVNMDKYNTVEKIVLSGHAFAQNSDKSVLGEEILFDAKAKSLHTLIGRPHTQLRTH